MKYAECVKTSEKGIKVGKKYWISDEYKNASGVEFVEAYKDPDGKKLIACYARECFDVLDGKKLEPEKVQKLLFGSLVRIAREGSPDAYGVVFDKYVGLSDGTIVPKSDISDGCQVYKL